jgi:hypothetical protein
MEPTTPTTDGARNAARAGRVTAESVLWQGGWRGLCGAGRPWMRGRPERR